jgi:signal transduction histidine kinase/CheY-like chemotaxis protein
MYDLQLTPHPALEQVEEAERLLWERLGDRPLEAFLDLPLADDADIEAALDLLARMLPSAYFVDLHLHRLIACYLVDLTLRYGVAAPSPMGLAAYGFELCALQRDAEADRLGRVALALVDRHGFDGYRAKVCNLLGAALVIWTRDLRVGVECSRDGVRAGIESGDVLFACLCWVQVVVVRLAAGDPLEEIEREAEEAIAFTRAARFDPLADCVTLARQLVRCLQGRTEGSTSFGDGGFDERAFADGLPAHPLPLIATWFHVYKLEAQVIDGDVEGALASTRALGPVLVLLRGQHAEVDADFFSALALAAACDGAAPGRRATYLAQLRGHEQRLRARADSCPANFAHRADLVSAELARVEGRETEADERLARAVRAARAHGFPHVEALAHERAARALRARGHTASAEVHIREARTCYQGWGAHGKVRQLDRQFPPIAAPAPSTGASLDAGRLDALAVVKASQAISGEIVTERLLEKLLEVVIAQAGARRGALLLARPGGLVVAATAAADGDATEVTIHDPPTEVTTEVLPRSVINYVRRTREPLILGHAAHESPFSSDPYVTRRAVKAVLCAPIVAQTELRGLVYLENDLIANAFTPARLAMLEVLAAQAAISLENASLYADLRREIAERQRAEDSARASERNSRLLFESSPVPMWIHDRATLAVVQVNDAAVAQYGYSRDEFLALKMPQIDAGESRHRKRDGSQIEVRVVAHEVRFGGRTARFVMAEDVGERERLERQLRQAQRMEAIGRLAGGVAHDFNNLLTAVVGYADLLLGQIALGEPHRAETEQIKQAGERAVALTRQLLTFGRSQELDRVVLDVNETVRGLEPMLRRLIRADVAIKTKLAADAGPIQADQGQIEQVLVNLVVNAGHAMPDGGRLTITTAATDLDEEYFRLHPAGEGPPGRYTVLEVTDTGVGLDDETMSHIFEPFFTTKGEDQGTGLGLATVYGIVRQSGGFIVPYSEPGRGASFKIYLPAVDADIEARLQPEPVTLTAARESRVLLVDDDPVIRTLVRHMLDAHQFEILEAADGDEAIALSEARHPDSLDLLITDTVVPGPGGIKLADRIRQRHPGLATLVMSGYSEAEATGETPLGPRTDFIAKPFTRADLDAKLTALLDASG